MSYLAVYLVTLGVFLALDYLGLSYIVKPVFERDIGPLLRDEIALLPALLFYAFFIAVIVVFVSAPALRDGWGLLSVAFYAALLGAAAYGTYEFTNLATLKGWTWRLVVTDLVWGTVLTSVTATIGITVTRSFT